MADPLPPVDAPRLGRPARALFVATILAGSLLLFLVQPMVARMALPRLGGAPAVWNSAMLVYQALLLAGYAYAHLLARLRPRVQAGVHLALLLLAALWLPLGLVAATPPPDGQPVLWTPWLLGCSIGPLFLAVSAQSPLIQRWYGAASGGRDPYPLYAASNLGSFAGLLCYPLLIEPILPLHEQSRLWSVGYVLLIALVAACAMLLPARPTSETRATLGPSAGRRRVLHWIALAAVPSGLMLATSTHVTTDIVAMPLVWVVPLGLYLLSFTVAFAARRSPADVLTRVAPITILLFGGVMIAGYQERPWSMALMALALLFMASVALHTHLFRLRPAPDRLTGFYLALALGGALGGAVPALLAPVLFDWTYEYPLLILAAGLLAPQQYLTTSLRALWHGRSGRVALAAVAAVIALLFVLRAADPSGLFGEERPGLTFVAIAGIGLLTIGARLPFGLVLAGALLLFGGYRALALSIEGGARTRSYFGVYTVRDRAGERELDHGTTVHGVQLRGSPDLERLPTTYYAPGSGIGLAIAAAPALYGPAARIGVVGLGTGTLACYARPGQRWRFFEIDPAIVRIARDTGQFSFLSRCLPRPEIGLGDARLSLAATAPASLDLLALDAFSSDAVPTHLMTAEAFATYARALSRRGLLLVHISNRFVDLAPVVFAAARDGGWRAARLVYQPSSLDRRASSSDWIALARDPIVLASLRATSADWGELYGRRGFKPWTDDHSTVLPLVKGFGRAQ